MSRRHLLGAAAAGVAAGGLSTSGISTALSATTPNLQLPGIDKTPIVLKDQGSFAFGGVVLNLPNGEKLHGDHGYVQYQIPLVHRKLPIVMWHGFGQFSKTWETTPDGRDGFQNIFLRRGFSTYIIDQPRRGRAGRGTVGTTINPTQIAKSFWWPTFQLGVYPNFFPGVQFPGAYDPAALDQYLRQLVPDTGPIERQVLVDAVAALFNKIGPAILLTHSNGVRYGWSTAIKAPNVKAIIAYESGSYVFPDDDLPPAPPGHEVIPVPPADFLKLTKIPIQCVFGDNIPTTPQADPNVDRWRTAVVQTKLFVQAINSRGGKAELLSLPDVGVFGNTHFAFSDLNNIQVANLLSAYLKRNGLDGLRVGA